MFIFGETINDGLYCFCKTDCINQKLKLEVRNIQKESTNKSMIFLTCENVDICREAVKNSREFTGN